jgi:hypothetical protein
MFRQIAATTLTADRLFNLHPIQIAAMLEEVWDRRLNTLDDPAIVLGHPDRRSNLNQLPPFLPTPKDDPIDDADASGGDGGPVKVAKFRWDHLIYAYMIENTRIYEIFRGVLYELVHGERLGTPIAEAQRWVRTTEELFFKDGAPFLITSVASHLRSDLRANRRNAYHRMFNMDLNHGGEDGKPYPYVRTDSANGDFVATFEEFLREVWIGMTYVTATASSNPTDPAKIASLAEKLHDMMRSRRQNGNLSREEFAFVSAMSWFHLTLEFDSPIVRSLRAEATGTDQRLFKVAERVKVPAHGLAKHFFEIADPISRILIQIEFGDYNDPAAVPALFTPDTTVAESPETAMREIIMNWTAIRGVDVKSRKVTPA